MAEPGTSHTEAPPSLKDAAWLKRRATARVFAALSGKGSETRAVGGAVRDTLLGLPVTDVDFATTIRPDKVVALARKNDLKAVPTGIEHGTVTVVVGAASFEVTTLRRDIETFGRHAKVTFTKDWAEDAKRRDFTLNALYADANGVLYDPLGGYADLIARHVRFIGEAEARIKEDFLRILRFFRFNASYGKGGFDQTGLRACVRQRAGLAQLSAERIASELKRLLVAPRTFEAVSEMFDYGLLSDILGSAPRLSRFATVIAIEAELGREPNAMVRLAALSVFVAEDASRLATRFRLSKAEQAVLALGAEPFEGGLPEEAAAKRLLYRLGPERFVPYVMLAWAGSGAPATDPDWHRAAALPARWNAPVFPLRGPDITALGDFAGPQIGAMLRAIEQRWIADGFAQDREALLALAKKLASS